MIASGLNAVKCQTKNKCCTIFITNNRAPIFFRDIFDEMQLKTYLYDDACLPIADAVADECVCGSLAVIIRSL